MNWPVMIRLHALVAIIFWVMSIKMDERLRDSELIDQNQMRIKGEVPSFLSYLTLGSFHLKLRDFYFDKIKKLYCLNIERD